MSGVRLHRAFSLCVAAAALCVMPFPAAEAQATDLRVSPTAPLDSQYIADLTDVHDRILALADAIPAGKYAWRPSSKVRTVSELLMHVAGEWRYLCPLSVGVKAPADQKSGEEMAKMERITDKAAVLTELNATWESCRARLMGMSPARLVPDSLPAKMGFPRVVLRIAGDQHEHLGQLIAYARSVDVTPPWSK